MKQSLTLDNNQSFSGVLFPLVESLEKNKPAEGKLSGKEIVLPGKDLLAIIAYDFTGNLHLLIPQSGEKSMVERFNNIPLKGITVILNELEIEGYPRQQYFDLCCITGSYPTFKRPFLRLVEDILFDLTNTVLMPIECVYKTFIKWQSFWSKEKTEEVSKDWIQGLYGELVFLSQMIDDFGPKVLMNWTGPNGLDHDFQTGTKLAVEIKTSTLNPSVIVCNIKQLDSKLFDKLYLGCYQINYGEAEGSTLPEIVYNIISKLEDVPDLTEFYNKLALVGYVWEDEDQYRKLIIRDCNLTIYQVTESFPKISENSFKISPDHRISNIKYKLELVGLESLKYETLLGVFEKFKG